MGERPFDEALRSLRPGVEHEPKRRGGPWAGEYARKVGGAFDQAAARQAR